MKSLDILLTTTAIGTYYLGWGQENKIAQNICAGIQGFALANLVDRTARLILPAHTPATAPLINGLFSAIAEETLYAGVLMTTSRIWIPVRVITTMVLGMTAVRRVVHVSDNTPPPRIDLKVGFAWAIAREGLLQLLPKTYSTTLLGMGDALIFSCGHASHDYTTQAHIYNAISRIAFRSIATHFAERVGIGASIVQHALFNISRSP